MSSPECIYQYVSGTACRSTDIMQLEMKGGIYGLRYFNVCKEHLKEVVSKKREDGFSIGLYEDNSKDKPDEEKYFDAFSKTYSLFDKEKQEED